MTDGSVRGIAGSGKGQWRDPAIAYPRGLLARARVLAEREARASNTNLAAAVRALSEAYTRHREGLAELPATRARYVGGLGFFFARDLPKAVSVVDELRARGQLPHGEPLRLLDLGAGLGTTSLGIAHWAKATGFADRVEIDAVERDAGALSRMRELVAQADGSDELPQLVLRTHAADLEAFLARDEGRYHLALLGLALNELAPSTEARFALLRSMAGCLTHDGVALVIEPALHDTTRDLMTVRDRVAADPSLRIVGPCTHHAPCPMLAAGPRDWCHAELPLELPAEEAALAHAAHLRDVKPTFAWLALGRGERPPVDVPLGRLHRVVSRALPSKGKQEIHLCADGTIRRLTALDRDQHEPALDSLRRGALITLRADRGLGASPRLGRDCSLLVVAD